VGSHVSTGEWCPNKAFGQSLRAAVHGQEHSCAAACSSTGPPQARRPTHRVRARAPSGAAIARPHRPSGFRFHAHRSTVPATEAGLSGTATSGLTRPCPGGEDLVGCADRHLAARGGMVVALSVGRLRRDHDRRRRAVGRANPSDHRSRVRRSLGRMVAFADEQLSGRDCGNGDEGEVWMFR
jgi:hypothetical protein